MTAADISARMAFLPVVVLGLKGTRSARRAQAHGPRPATEFVVAGLDLASHVLL
jgi:hypothetical protein